MCIYKYEKLIPNQACSLKIFSTIHTYTYIQCEHRYRHWLFLFIRTYDWNPMALLFKVFHTLLAFLVPKLGPPHPTSLSTHCHRYCVISAFTVVTFLQNARQHILNNFSFHRTVSVAVSHCIFKVKTSPFIRMDRFHLGRPLFGYSDECLALRRSKKPCAQCSTTVEQSWKTI